MVNAINLGCYKVPAASGYRVWARVAWMALDVARRSAVSTRGVFDGMRLDERSIREKQYIDWNDFALLCDRLTENAGGVGLLSSVLEGNLMIPEFRHLIGALVRPMTLSRVMQDAVLPAAFPACGFVFEELSRRRYRVRVTLRPNARPSLSWFAGYIYGLRCEPQHLGLPPAVVSGSFSDSHGCYEVELPEPRSLVSKLTLASNHVFLPFITGRSPDGGLTATSFGNALGRIDSRVAEVAGRWQLTRRQMAVLHRLVRGDSNKEVSAEMDCAESTVEFHVTQLLRKAGVTSRTQLIATFWQGNPTPRHGSSAESVENYFTDA